MKGTGGVFQSMILAQKAIIAPRSIRMVTERRIAAARVIYDGMVAVESSPRLNPFACHTYNCCSRAELTNLFWLQSTRIVSSYPK